MEVLGRNLTVSRPDGSIGPGQNVRLVVRPEAIQVVEEGGQYRGIVRWASYLGSLVEYEVEVNGQKWVIIDSDPRHTVIYPRGREVGVRLLEDCIYVLPE
jgi:ABC-type Fe3+/spermidine/putrescine transport system ATPase subunit